MTRAAVSTGVSALARVLTVGALVRRHLASRRPHVRAARRQRAAFYERVWRDAAATLGAEVRPLGADVLEIGRGAVRARVSCNYTSLDDPITLRLAGNKPAVYRLLGERGVPTPDHLEFSLRSIDRAVAFLSRAGRACVVKPASGTGAGAGVTTGIRRPSQLLRAVATAAAFSRALLIEEEATGENYRLLYLDGQLLDVVRRDPPVVVGDGSRSVRQLIRDTNTRRLHTGWRTAQTLIPYDGDMRETLSRQGLSLSSVPAPGQRVRVKTVINDNAADDTAPVAGLFCQETIGTGALAAASVGVRLAGVDVITPDPSRPLEAVGGVILEVNTTPGLYHHKRGDGCPVASTILDAMLAATGAPRMAGSGEKHEPVECGPRSPRLQEHQDTDPADHEQRH